METTIEIIMNKKEEIFQTFKSAIENGVETISNLNKNKIKKKYPGINIKLAEKFLKERQNEIFQKYLLDYNNLNKPTFTIKSIEKIKKMYPGIKSSDVKKHWKTQTTYSRYKKTKKRPKKYNPVITKHIAYLFEADILYIDEDLFPEERNNGYKYILNIIDTFSKVVFCYKMREKTGKNVLKGLKIWWRKIEPNLVDGRASKFRSDNGTEFKNELVADWFAENPYIRQYFSNTIIKCPYVERFNRTLQENLVEHATKVNTNKWIKILDDVVKNYHNTPHSAFNEEYTPNEANLIDNEDEIKYYHAKRYEGIKKRKPSFKIGDTVRPLKKTAHFKQRAYHPTHTDQRYTIFRVFDNLKFARYLISPLGMNRPLKERYHSYELLSVD